MELVHWPDCTNAPCTCVESGAVLFAGTVSRVKSQQLASALVAVFRLLKESNTEGRRRLFEAVNEAFCYVATESAVR